jgi:hypothetical protein
MNTISQSLFNQNFRPSIPNPPEGFPDHLSYREWLNWRGGIQALCLQFSDKTIPLKNIKESVNWLIRKSTSFPTQPFPDNLLVRNLDGEGFVLCDPNRIIEKLGKRFGVVVDMDKGKKIETAGDFAEELERFITTF